MHNENIFNSLGLKDSANLLVLVVFQGFVQFYKFGVRTKFSFLVVMLFDQLGEG